MPPDPWDLYGLHFWSPSEGIVAADNGTAFLFSDTSGPAWITVRPAQHSSNGTCPLTQGNIEFYGVDVNPANPDEVWMSGGVGTTLGYVYRSQDRGLTWAQERDLLPPVFTNAGGCGMPTMYGIAAFAGVEAAIMVGYGNHVRRHLPLPTQAVPMRGDPPAPALVLDLCGCVDGAPFTPGLPVWQKFPLVNEDAEIKPLIWAAARTASNKAVIGGTFGVLRRSDDITVAWDDPLVGWIEEGTEQFIRLEAGDFVGAGEGAVIGQGHQIRHTSDGGLTWTDAYTPNPLDLAALGKWGRAIDLEPLSPNTLGVAVGDDGFLAYSTTGGASWTVPTTSDTTDWHGVAFVPGSTDVVAVGEAGAVFFSSNGGMTWSASPTSPGSTDLYGVSFVTSQLGYVVGEDQSVWRTQNGGLTWQSVRVNGGQAGNDYLDIYAWNSGLSAIAVGEGGEVAIFNGTAFQAENPLGISESLNDVEVLVGTTTEYWVAGNGGSTLHFDGTAWESPKSQTSYPMVSLAFTSASQGYGVARQFVITEYN